MRETTCASCSREFGAGVACRFCGQVQGLHESVHLSSPLRRLAGAALEPALFVVTLGIGWLGWTFFIAGQGQTPAKQLLGMRIVRLDTGRAAGWWRVFVREVIAKPVVSILSSATAGITHFWLLWDRDNQQLYDKLSGTIVVNDPLARVAFHRAAAVPPAAVRQAIPEARYPDHLEHQIRKAEASVVRPPSIAHTPAQQVAGSRSTASFACPHCGGEELDDLKQIAECAECGKRFRRPDRDLAWKECPSCGGTRRTVGEAATCAACGAELRRSV